MDVVFRKAVPADAPEMARLIVLAWQKAYRSILSDELLDNRNAESGAQRIREGIETKPAFQYCVLEHGQRIVGISVICPSSDNDLPDATAIQVFYIHPELQRQGFGRMLMRYTLDTMLAAGNQHIILWVLKDNHSARAFYETMGFRLDGAEKTLPRLENAHTVRYRYRGTV